MNEDILPKSFIILHIKNFGMFFGIHLQSYTVTRLVLSEISGSVSDCRSVATGGAMAPRNMF